MSLTKRETERSLVERAHSLLKNNIGPFWRDHLYNESDRRFYGLLDDHGKGDRSASVHLILIARALWAYSVLFATLEEPLYLERADAAYRVIIENFWDPHFGGVFSETTYEGIPLTAEKQTFAQAFAIIGLARYAAIKKEKQALAKAQELFSLLQKRAQHSRGGYTDVLQRNWRDDADIHIWWMNRGGAPYIFNSQLHMLEAAIELFGASKKKRYRDALASQLSFITTHFFGRVGGHLFTALDEKKRPLELVHAYGNELEAAYLLRRAATLCGRVEHIGELATDMVTQIAGEAWDMQHRGFFFSYTPASEELNRTKVWWVQAEGMVGVLDAYQATDNSVLLNLASELWQYFEDAFVDWQIGEVRASAENPYTDPLSVQQQAARDRRTGAEKASAYKCPYHTVRACTEIIDRLGGS